jgi:HD-GYP domain-containing protein (c-di-GMP phosphodiesterase class II)/DNA-binding CsgD family transcriptional regulator
VALRLADPLLGLSAIGDVGRGREPGQAARTCFIACRLARSLDADEETVREVFYASLLQHIGCVAHAHDTAPLDGGRNIELNAVADETDFSRPADILNRFLVELSPEAGLLKRLGLMLPARRMGRALYRTSCEVAESTARRIGLPEDVQVVVRHLSEWYNGGGGYLGRKGEEIPLAARVVPAAFTASLFDLLAGPDGAVAAIRARSARIVDPTVADAFTRDGPGILAELAAVDLLRRLPDEEPEPPLLVPDGAVDEIVVAFGEAVDLKTPFTHGSARRSFELTEKAGSALGLEDVLIAQARRAAALRDIGKAAIPNAVLEKPGPLTEIEWESVRLHAYHSERVLSRSAHLANEAMLAGLHHERPDGSGYHRGLAGTSIPIAARVVAASDALVAMTQPRPYRSAMSLDQACETLERAARGGRFDADAVSAVVAAGHGTGGRIRRGAPADLTDRQIEVLRLIAEGLSNRQIAERLVVSPRTAEHHVQDIYLKIGTSSRAAAALFAVEHQLL